jgi:hypothetical protein
MQLGRGICRVFRAKVAVHLFCTALEKDFIDDLVKSWGEHYTKNGTSFAACVVNLPSWSLEPGFTVGEIFHGTITKKFLMSLPDGAWLCIPGASDQGVDPIQPGTDRQRLWEKLTERGIAARRRYILWSLADIRSMQQAWAMV